MLFGLSSPAYLSTAMASVIASGRFHVFEKCYQDAEAKYGDQNTDYVRFPILYHEGMCCSMRIRTSKMESNAPFGEFRKPSHFFQRLE